LHALSLLRLLVFVDWVLPMQKPHFRAAVMVSSLGTESSSRGSTSTDSKGSAVDEDACDAGTTKGRDTTGANAEAVEIDVKRATTDEILRGTNAQLNKLRNASKEFSCNHASSVERGST